jgi:hypothetical protein
MFQRALLASCLLLSFAAHAADEPKWLKDARARELKSLKPSEIKSKDGWFRVNTPGKLVGSIEKAEGSYSVELDIGGDSSVHCEVYPDGVDLANALRITLDGAFKNIEASQGKLEVRALETTDAGAYGAVPYITVSWIYRVSTDKGPMLGAFKQFVMEKGKQAVYCAHNDLGYTRTFETITRAFADTLQTEAPPVTPHYFEVATASMSGNKIGVMVSSLEKDTEGDIRARQITAMFIATDDGNVRSQDSTQIQWLRSDGSLINAATADVGNGELENDLSLKETDGVWTVEGEVQGKVVKTSLPKDSQPGSWLTQAWQLRELLAAPDAVGREHTIGMWIAENPEKLTVTKTKILAKRGDQAFTARADVGGMSADLLLDKASGMATAADIKVGLVSM